MTWIILIILPAFLWAVVNHLDKYLLDKYCKDRSVGALVLFSSLIGIPVILFSHTMVDQIYILSISEIVILILSGCFYIIGIIFYLYALQHSDASTIAPQMLLGPIFTYILSFLILNEVLSVVQFISCLVILFAAFGLNFEYEKRSLSFEWKNFLFMCVAALFMAASAICFKFIAREIDFWLSIMWTHVGFVFIGFILFFCVKSYRNDFNRMLIENGSGIVTVNIISEIITIVGNIAFNYVLLLAPVVLVQIVTEGVQPVFVLILGVILTILFPKLVHENMRKSALIKKSILVVVMLMAMISISL